MRNENSIFRSSLMSVTCLGVELRKASSLELLIINAHFLQLSPAHVKPESKSSQNKSVLEAGLDLA